MNTARVFVTDVDVETLESACEALARAGHMDLWTRLSALALRVQAESGLRAPLPANVIRLERKVGT